MCTVFRFVINLCKIMLDSKSRAITQTIHTNLVGLFSDAGYVGKGTLSLVDRTMNILVETKITDILHLCYLEYTDLY